MVQISVCAPVPAFASGAAIRAFFAVKTHRRCALHREAVRRSWRGARIGDRPQSVADDVEGELG